MSCPELPVAMCVWNRIELLERTLAQLERQRGATPLLHLWVNNPAVLDEARARAATASFPVQVHASVENVGGFGLYTIARELADEHPYVVFVDDDQSFPDDMLATLAAEAAPQSIVAWWAFAFHDEVDYWRRRPLEPGEEADYCGSGGTVVDTSIFRDARLFDCPERFRPIWDLWLSYFASTRGWRLAKSGATLALEEDGKDLYHGLMDEKSAFLRHLVAERGWLLPSRRVVAAGAGEPLVDARSLRVLALAAELLARPELLAAAARSLGAADDASIVIATPEASIPELERAIAAAGLDVPDGPDLLAVATDSAGVARLAADADAVYGLTPPARDGAPRFDADTLGQLRATLLGSVAA